MLLSRTLCWAKKALTIDQVLKSGILRGHVSLFRNIIFIVFCLIPVHQALADLVKEHVEPTAKDGFDSTGLYIILGGVGATLLAQTQDYWVRENFGDHQKMSASTSYVGDLLGRGYVEVAIAGGQLYFDNPNGWAHSEALIGNEVVTVVGKYSMNRGRPASENHHSMPSGHTSVSFATASSLAYAYGWKAAVPSFALASFVAAARWSDDAHWFSDTVAGAFIGFFWGRATSFHHNIVTPVVLSDGSPGLSFSKTF